MTAHYDPWGTPEGGSISPFGFTGELQDAAGLVYLRARWYTPQTGTLLSRDPFVGFPAQPFSLHPYQYAYGNPVTWTDPSGEVVIALPLVVGGALAVLALAGMVTAATLPHQAAIQDATDSLGILFDEDAQTQARFQAIATAIHAFEHLAEVAWRNEGFQLDDESNGMQVLIFVVTSAPCFLNEGFALQAPSLDDVIRLGPTLTDVLGKLVTGFPLPQEESTNVLASVRVLPGADPSTAKLGVDLAKRAKEYYKGLTKAESEGVTIAVSEVLLNGRTTEVVTINRGVDPAVANKIETAVKLKGGVFDQSTLQAPLDHAETFLHDKYKNLTDLTAIGVSNASGPCSNCRNYFGRVNFRACLIFESRWDLGLCSFG